MLNSDYANNKSISNTTQVSEMQWVKLGNLFCPSGEIDWMQTHATLPITEHIEGDLFRIYFSSRDNQNRSHTGYVIIDITAPFNILEVSKLPVICPGELGTFDDSGASASWLTTVGNTRYLYYVGWNLGVTVPFRNSIGVAISENGEPFKKLSPGPIVDRTMFEPHFCVTCCVLNESDIWKMWYISCTGWIAMKNAPPRHMYHIKYAQSSDGINWRREGQVAIDFEKDEYAISRPSVIKENNIYKMWFSSRGGNGTYRIHYAESQNGVNFTRLPGQDGIDVSDSGWDSDMIEYPCVFDHKGKRYMLYNGNGYGKTGFGLAVLEE